MIKLETSLFGEMEISDDKIIYFPSGIPGFEDMERFTIIEPDPSIPFSYLQSVQNGELQFILVDPFVCFSGYEIEIPEAVQEELQIQSFEELVIRSIVSVQDKLDKATANLLAPIVINVKKMIGKQVVLHDSVFTTRHNLFVPSVSE
ncbi:flagellar assembly protein FliW [Paenibacillus hamazuiensis]|uniref:flagellar assembly protein FliW n=1 Tax=Paenibacillus hamazuiensis TaxID=2936508 RepID=UPI00200CB31D|nr:flagellar assembly protein FliW [Paenibacillus hamazuiensis]